jgi:hypothetical protein
MCSKRRCATVEKSYAHRKAQGEEQYLFVHECVVDFWIFVFLQTAIQAVSNCTQLTTFFKSVPSQEVSRDTKNVTEAEIRWVWHSAETSKSFNCEDKAADLFRAMFPDSAIAQKFSCGRTKQQYLLTYAIVPYVVECIARDISDGYFSIGFDESDGMMMIMVRYLKDGLTRTEMLDLVDLKGLYDADHCAAAITTAITNAKLPFKHCIGDFSDKCNTMRGTLFQYYIIIAISDD